MKLSAGSLRAAEDTFQQAMRHNDVDALDALLHSEVHFVGPDGTTADKTTDLELHRSGRLVVDSLTEIERAIQIVSGVGLIRVILDLALRVDGSPINARVAYTRVWAFDDQRWQVIAAHGSSMAPHSADGAPPRLDECEEQD